MRVQLIGSHGTGKSTLLQEYKRRHPEIHQQDGVSRPIKKCAKELGLTGYQQQYICHEVAYYNWINSMDIPNFFATRSLLDDIVYSKALGYEDLSKDLEERFSKLDLSQVIWFYLPIEFELEDDGVRFNDPKFQLQIDSMLKEYSDKYKIKYITLSGSIDDRIKQMENVLLK